MQNCISGTFIQPNSNANRLSKKHKLHKSQIDFISTHIRMYVYIYGYMHMYMYGHLKYTLYPRIYVYIHMDICIYIWIHVYIYVYMYMCIRGRIKNKQTGKK